LLFYFRSVNKQFYMPKNLRGVHHDASREIDNLVYNLYGLTEEERKIVDTAA